MAASYEARVSACVRPCPSRPPDGSAPTASSSPAISTVSRRRPTRSWRSSPSAPLSSSRSRSTRRSSTSPRPSICSAARRRSRATQAQRCAKKLGLVLSVGRRDEQAVREDRIGPADLDGLVIVPPGASRVPARRSSCERLWGVGPKTRECSRAGACGRSASWRALPIVSVAGSRSSASTDGHLGTRERHRRGRGLDSGQGAEVGRPLTHVRSRTRWTRRRSSRRSSGCPRAWVGDFARRTLRGKTITLKLRVAPFETRSRQRTLAGADRRRPERSSASRASSFATRWPRIT